MLVLVSDLRSWSQIYTHLHWSVVLVSDIRSWSLVLIYDSVLRRQVLVSDPRFRSLILVPDLRSDSLDDLVAEVPGSTPLPDAAEAESVAAGGQDAEPSLRQDGLLDHHLHADGAHLDRDGTSSW